MKAALRVAGITAVLGFGASGCPLLHAYTQKPDVKLQKVDVTNVDFQGANLEALLMVTNKVPVGITIGKVTWGVSLEGSKLVSGEVANGLTIEGKSSAPVKVPFGLKFEDLFKISQKYKDQDTAPYRLEGTMAIDTPIGPVTIPFHHDGTVPVLKIPEVDLSRVEVRGMNMTGADVRLSFHVRNPNNLALGVSSLDYNLNLAGARVAEGKLPGALDLAAKSTGSFDADIKVSFVQAAQAAQSLVNKNTAEYQIGGSIAAKTPWGVVSTPYSRSGTVKIQR
jgi:LEA14-like dessication related protein